jgi:hypothetical protein
MKCEICNFQENPDNLEKLAVQAETCGNPTCKTAKIVWRDGQMTLTMSPTSDEPTFNVEIRDVPPAPEPPILLPKKSAEELDVTMMALETTSRSKKKDPGEHDPYR